MVFINRTKRGKIEHTNQYKNKRISGISIWKNRVGYKIKNRKHFRIFKAKGGYKYKPSKRIKHISKAFIVEIIQQFGKKSYSLLDVLIHLKIYKQALLIKILVVVIPMVILVVTDGVAISISITTINVFLCTLFFSFCVVEKGEATLNGRFDYGLYKYLKAKKETIVILLTFFAVMINIIIGHYYFNDAILILTGIEI